MPEGKYITLAVAEDGPDDVGRYPQTYVGDGEWKQSEIRFPGSPSFSGRDDGLNIFRGLPHDSPKAVDGPSSSIQHFTQHTSYSRTVGYGVGASNRGADVDRDEVLNLDDLKQHFDGDGADLRLFWTVHRENDRQVRWDVLAFGKHRVPFYEASLTRSEVLSEEFRPDLLEFERLLGNGSVYLRRALAEDYGFFGDLPTAGHEGPLVEDGLLAYLYHTGRTLRLQAVETNRDGDVTAKKQVLAEADSVTEMVGTVLERFVGDDRPTAYKLTVGMGPPLKGGDAVEVTLDTKDMKRLWRDRHSHADFVEVVRDLVEETPHRSVHRGESPKIEAVSRLTGIDQPSMVKVEGNDGTSILNRPDARVDELCDRVRDKMIEVAEEAGASEKVLARMRRANYRDVA